MLLPVLILFLGASPHAFVPQSAPAAAELSAPAVRSSTEAAEPLDDELEGWRRELLELAFDAVSDFPLEPHVKNRSRAQEAVAEAAIELGQLRLAARFAQDIANWRRGSVEAELALALVERGELAAVDALLARAVEAAAEAGVDEAQGWRRDRILAKVAIAERRLGRPIDPKLEIEASEQGRLRAERMQHADLEQLEVELETFARAVELDDFEATKAALQGYVELHDRFYDDPEQRARFERLTRAAWPGIPIPLAVQSELGLVENALRHEDPEQARRLVDGAIEHVSAARWATEHRVPVEARLAALNFRAGRPEEARAQANAAFHLFETQADEVVSIYRAEALIPLAEAFVQLGQPGTAGAVYTRALDEAWVNPNARPRAEDFARICCSMALRAYEPDEVLSARLSTARGELGDPW